MSKTYEISNFEYTNLEPCALEECNNPVQSARNKYCSEKCRTTWHGRNQNKLNKQIHKRIGSAPRAMVSESSINPSESFVSGNGAYVIDDYAIDPDVFAIAELNHDIQVEARSEYEARVVFDGLAEFTKVYNKNHTEPYANKYSKINYQKRKNDVNFVENNKKSSKAYYQRNKEELRAKRKAKYFYIKQPDLYKHEKWLKRKISGS
jgi:hypothetical protein